MHEIVQGSDEWHRMRCGRVTASRVADVIAQNRARSGWGKSRETYMGELIAERLSGYPTDGYKNAAMERGNEVEPDARNAYAFYSNEPVTEVAFVPHPTIKMSGASPDGLVGEHGLVQFKCPANTAIHVDTLTKGTILGRYHTQMMWELACTGRQWCDFASYDPRLPPGLSLHTQRIMRDDERIAELEAMVRDFLAELDAKIEQLKAMYDFTTPDDLPTLAAG